MQLNHSTDLALRTLIYLGRKKEIATIQEISLAFDISKPHLMKVVMTLVSANFLNSIRGRNGGIELGKNPQHISVADIVRLMENNLNLVACMKAGARNDTCPLLPRCKLKKALMKAQHSFFDSLESYSLADLL